MQQYNEQRKYGDKQKEEEGKRKVYTNNKRTRKKKKVGWSLFIRIVDLEHKNKQLLISISKSKIKY